MTTYLNPAVVDNTIVNPAVVRFYPEEEESVGGGGLYIGIELEFGGGGGGSGLLSWWFGDGDNLFWFPSGIHADWITA